MVLVKSSEVKGNKGEEKMVVLIKWSKCREFDEDIRLSGQLFLLINNAISPETYSLICGFSYASFFFFF